MASLLTTDEILAQIKDIILTAEKELLLISPYLALSDSMKSTLLQRPRNGADTTLIYRKDDDQDRFTDQIRWLENVAKIQTKYCPKMHTKCYLNEERALLTSINLTESSETNFEAGILIPRKQNQRLYEDTHAACHNIVDVSKPTNPLPETPTKVLLFCIRCGKPIPFKAGHTHCTDHYKSWSRHQNPDYKENFCASCGVKHKTTRASPHCEACRQSS